MIMMNPASRLLTHFRLNELPHNLLEESIFDLRCFRLRYLDREKLKHFANSGDPDQTPSSAASDLGLHCLPITL